MAVLFNGKTLITPTAETAIDDSRMYPVRTAGGAALALIGESAGGIPKTAIRIRSPLHAKMILRSGPLYEAAIRAFSPAVSAGSPAAVYAVRVNPSVQSSLTLDNATDVDTIALKSTDYGAHTNSIEVKVEAGSAIGKKITIRQDTVSIVRDDLGAEVLSVEYDGASPTAHIECAAGVLTLENPTNTAVKTLTLASYSSADALAEAISGTTGWTATSLPGKERFIPSNLDGIDSEVTPAGAAVKLNGHLWTIVDWFNSAGENLLDATQLVVQGLPPKNIGFTALTGGALGSVQNTDWEGAFAALYEVDVSWLVPLSSSSTIWAMAQAHCEYLSGNKKERRAFVGGGTGVTAAQAITNAQTINSDRVAYVYPAVYERNAITGRLELKEAFYAAVNLAAAFASINPGETMSRKSISVAGTEPVTISGASVMLREPVDTDALIEGGVLTLVQGQNGVFVSQAVTTWQSDERYNRREVSVGAAVDYVARSVRNGMAVMLGTRASGITIARAQSRLESILDDLSRSPPAGPGVLVGDADSPPYRGIDIQLQGDVLRISFECSPVLPINYVLIGISITPYAGAATV
jgi:hypothetical protein